MVVSLSHSNDRRLPDTSSSCETIPTEPPPTTGDDDVSPLPTTNTPIRRLSSTDAPPAQTLGHHEHHKSAGAVLSVSQQTPTTEPTSTSTSTTHHPLATHQRSVYSHNRTRSDDVVLRTKSAATNPKPISTAKSKNPMDRSFSIPASPTDAQPPNDDIETIRAFLESEYVAPTDEFWHLQRDSFIHRSYNKKLLARKNAIDCNEVPKRPASLPVAVRKQRVNPPTTDGSSNESGQPTTAVFKRESFIRHSLNTLRRSFSIRSAKKKSAQMEQQTADSKERRIGRKQPTLETEPPIGNGNHRTRREMGTVSDEGERWDHVEPTQFLNVPLESVRQQIGHSRNSSTSSCTSNRSTNSGAVLNLRSAPSTPMAPLQSQSGSDTNASSTVTSASQQQPTQMSSLLRSPGHHVSAKSDAKSLKHLQTSSSQPTSASTPSSVATRSPSPHPAKAAKHDAPEKEKKEKKRKELSSGRQKKFHRHFQQVAADEHVINYFSCALVSDILLQGHLYITDNYFAFYSNVFGFVTKLLIPTVSVVRITKEKTAKIIPNAVGVATADERHVFGSFISREAAFQLMHRVWRPVAPVEPSEVAEAAAVVKLMIPVDVEASELSIEDDSSSAISGNESPPVGVHQESTTSTDASQTVRHRITAAIDAVDAACPTASPPDSTTSPYLTSDMAPGTTTTTTPSRSTSPPPKYVSLHHFYEFQFPDNFVRIGIVLSVLLVMLSVFLIYRIMNVPRAGPSTLADFGALNAKWQDADENMDVYAEVLKWQRQMQAKGADEAQIILNSNLEKIARVRKSLETLSILIHDKNSMGVGAGAAETYVPDKDSPLDASSFDRVSSEA